MNHCVWCIVQGPLRFLYISIAEVLFKWLSQFLNLNIPILGLPWIAPGLSDYCFQLPFLRNLWLMIFLHLPENLFHSVLQMWPWISNWFLKMKYTFVISASKLYHLTSSQTILNIVFVCWSHRDFLIASAFRLPIFRPGVSLCFLLAAAESSIIL